MRLIRPSLAALGVGAFALTIASCTDAPSAPSATVAPSLSQTSASSAQPQDGTLLACPVRAAQSFTVTLDERGVRYSRRGFAIDIPAGAIRGRQEFRVTLPRSRYVEAEIDAVGHAHYTFDKPITVTLDYSRCANSLQTAPGLAVWYIDSNDKSLLERMPGVDDRRSRRITFTTDHLSGYAVAYRSERAPGDSTGTGE